MATDNLGTAIGEVRTALLSEHEAGPGDAELLTRFLEHNDDAALAALVRRHSAMVWGVCRRTLPLIEDVEDAFQATFLVLVRRAGSVRPRSLLANWLYGVARQTALKARAMTARRHQREKQVTSMPEPAAREHDLRDDLLPLLDEELARLPAKYRAVVVLCDLEGAGRAVAARHLGVPEGTVASRLARARAMLAQRLARRGLRMGSAAVAAVLAQEAAARAPTAALASALRGASLLATGQAAALAVSGRVATLTEGVLKAMLLSRLEKMAALLLLLGVLTCGALVMAHPAPAGTAKEPAPAAGKDAAPVVAELPPGPLPAGALARFGSPKLQDFTIDRSATFSPDGKLLATSGSNSPICVWDLATGAKTRTYPNRGSVFDLRWRADGNLAALTFFGHDVFLMQAFDATADLTPEQEKQLQNAAMRRERGGEDRKGKPRRLNSCFLSADGQWVVANWLCGPSNECQAQVYPFASGQTPDTARAIHTIDLPAGYGAWISDDSKVLLAHETGAAGAPNKLHGFDLAAGKAKPSWSLSFPGPEADRRPDVCLSDDGKRVVVLFWDGAVELWDGPSGKRVRELGKLPWYYHHNNGERRGIDLSPDGKHLALIERHTSGQVGGRIAEVDTGKETCRLSARALPRSGGCARFSADGQRVVRVGFGVVAVWDARTGADLCPLAGHRGSPRSLASLDGGKTVVTAGDDLTVRAWSPANGKQVWQAAFPQEITVKFATPDGAVLVQETGFGQGGPASCLDGATGKARALPGALARADKEPFLACSPDGKIVVTLDPKKPALRTWSWPAGELQKTLPMAPPGKLQLARCAAAQFTPDGKQFVAIMNYSDPTQMWEWRQVPDRSFIERWDLASGTLVERTQGAGEQAPLLLPHPRGLYLWGKDNTVCDAVSGKAIVKVQVPDGRGISLHSVSALALSPDGNVLAINLGTPEPQVHLFEMRTGRLRGALPTDSRYLPGLAFLPDGRLVSLGMTATVWSVGLQPTSPPREGELAALWERLGDPSPETAWPLMGQLAAVPTEAVALVRKYVHAVPRLSPEALRRALNNLDAEDFKEREAASRELDRLGALAVPAAKERLIEEKSAEAKRRLEAFLARHDRPDLPPDELRSLRAVEVLEAISTPAARGALEELATGEPTARLTRDASAALRRLKKS